MKQSGKARGLAVLGFHWVDTGRDMTASVTHLGSTPLVTALEARDNLPHCIVDVKTAFLQACMGHDYPEVYVIFPRGIEPRESQMGNKWKL